MERFEAVVEVDAPVGLVFDMLSDFEGYPRWMGNVRGVWRAGRRMTHWVVGTALDIDVEWDAEVTAFVPDRRVVWRAVRGDVHADGEFVLAETPDATTLVRIVLGYDTPGGRTGGRAARFFGHHPRRQLEEDLLRFKRLAERAAGGERRERRERSREEARPRRRAPGLSERGGDRERPAREEPRPRHALTPREREREHEARRREEEHARRLRAGWYLRRGVDRLLDEPPHDRRRR
ncbi:MAG TPA: SRPBCC family protein [Pyrinomonadaceae bacterium]|nr:SRPBCC family protein [Pyrinomonadaceae bacterium]